MSDSTSTKLSNTLSEKWKHETQIRKKQLPDLFSDDQQCLRLVDQKNDGYCIDRFGDHLWVYRYLSSEIKSSENEAIQDIQSFTGTKASICRHMLNRGHSPHLEQEEKILNWTANEGPLKYHLSSESGWSPGLFLDQRENRKWVRENSKDKTVLNLFCYTAGFSLNAVFGGAKEVASVDTSSKTLDWAKRNFSLNDFASSNFEFFAADTRSFLQGCLRRSRKFDLIICDPPSFARNKKGVFRLEKEAESLVMDCMECLAKDGTLLFSCNFEKWSRTILEKNLRKWTKASVMPAPGKGQDFTGPSFMKSYLIRK